MIDSGSASKRAHLACEREDWGRCTSITECSGTTTGLQTKRLAQGTAFEAEQAGAHSLGGWAAAPVAAEAWLRR